MFQRYVKQVRAFFAKFSNSKKQSAGEVNEGEKKNEFAEFTGWMPLFHIDRATLEITKIGKIYHEDGKEIKTVYNSPEK